MFATLVRYGHVDMRYIRSCAERKSSFAICHRVAGVRRTRAEAGSGRERAAGNALHHYDCPGEIAFNFFWRADALPLAKSGPLMIN